MTWRNTEETWRPIEGYAYEVSDHGGVRRTKDGRAIHVRSYPNGYQYVPLWRDGKVRNFLVHRLVCTAFHGPCPPGLQVNHADGDKAHNVPGNLSYVTQSENLIHAYRTGLRTGPRGERQGCHRLTAETVRWLRERHRAGESYAALARMYGVDLQTVRRAIRRETWVDV